jgi:hypothetical protein
VDTDTFKSVGAGIMLVGMVDGIVVDVRTMPRQIREAAYLQGLIPYVPESLEGD